jgi:SAM-dependent methyltransferase/GT2 family glycosyltransferase
VAELSVVIPTLRRAGVLREALERLERQVGAEGRFEVVVAVDAADQDLPAVERAVGTRPYPVRVLQAPRAGASAARNAGWRAAQAPLVLFIGDDILAEPRLIAEHLDWHSRHPQGEVAVLGHVRWADSLRRTPFMRWLDTGWQYDYAAIRGDEAGWGRLYTSNVSLKRELLERSGGFDEDFPFLAEDTELGRRLHDLGLRLLYNRAARAEHLHAPTLEEWRGRMAVAAHAEQRLHDKHPDIPPYFLGRFRAALAEPPPRGRGARLARVVPPGTPVIGPKVWGSVDAQFRRALAPSYLEALDRVPSRPSDAPGDQGLVSGSDMRRFWDERAREDALYFVDSRVPYRDAAAEQQFWDDGRADLGTFLGQLEMEVRPGDRVVEIGCGVGRLTRPLSELVASVVALDVSSEMLDRARGYNPDAANVEWMLGDGVSLAQVGDASADAVISHVVFQHIPDPAITLGYVREIGRVLKPGGVAGFQVSNDPSIHRPKVPLRDRLAGLVGRAPRGRTNPAWLGSLIDLDDLRATADAAGMDVELIVGEGTQYCLVRTRARA